MGKKPFNQEKKGQNNYIVVQRQPLVRILVNHSENIEIAKSDGAAACNEEGRRNKKRAEISVA